jgi:trigger factor
MNITKENIDDLNAVLKVQIEKNDYEGKVENVLKDYRKKADIKGFRPGMVPIGLLKKMYGKAVQIDEINKIVSEGIHKYITDEKLDILGDPLPKTDEHEVIDFDTQESFTFSFELGLAPDIELNFSNKDKVNYYNITIDDKMKNDYVENYTRRFGELKKVGEIADKDVIRGKLEETDPDGNLLSDGIIVEEASISVEIISDNSIKELFSGKKLDDTINFNVKKAFKNDTEIASLLNKKKDEITDIKGDFRFTVKEISRFYPAEIGKELFDRIYGEGVVNNEEEFMNKLIDEISNNLKRESEYRFMVDIKKMAIDKSDVQFPEEFLKKWLLKVNDKATPELIDKEFDSFKNDLKWQLIRNKVAREKEMKISEEELQKEAENITRMQFQQYGLFYATEEQITNYAKETLSREDDAKRIADRILDEKVIAVLKDMVKLDDKDITVEEFNKLYEQ